MVFIIKTNEIIDFLETDVLSFDYSDNGLKYLSLKDISVYESIDLNNIDKEIKSSKVKKFIIDETIKFLKTGNHNMILDFSDFTQFQKDVFDAVSKVKAGTVCSYKGIGSAIGKPSAAQAVGSAVARNPVSYFLPTHRIVPQKGIGTCKSGAGFLREKLLKHEGQDIEKLKGNYICTRSRCCME